MFIDIRQTDEYEEWFTALKDVRLKVAILKRLEYISMGNMGDHKPLAKGIFELRIHYGAGYRIYYKRNGETVILLLCGGDKSTQQRSIKKAQELAKKYGV